MPTTVGQHSVAAFTSPVNGTTPIDANTVRGNDNTTRVAYVNHDADPGIHVQSSTLASRPTAGTAGRKWITADAGSYKLWYDDGVRWHEVGNDEISIEVIADATLAKGDVVSITGFNNGQNVPTVNKYDGTAPAFAIANEAIANGSRGYVVNTGTIYDIKTNTFGALGTMLYPAATGTFTSTKPTSGTYQTSAYVLRSNANNGVLYVEFSAPRIVETSANTANTVVLRDGSGNFAAGTITAGALTSTGLVTFASLKGTGATTVTNILDEDNMASDSATALATQQSIKAYVDAKVATVDTLAEVLANGNTTGANDIIVNAGQKIRTPVIASQNNATAITIADTTGALTLATALADSNLATISTAGKVANSATTATATNTNSAIVARDGSGNFSAGTITANLTGNISGTAPAGTLTGTTLASNVVSSSLTSVGTLSSLTVSGVGTFNGGLTSTQGIGAEVDDATTNGISTIADLSHKTTGTAAAGIGAAVRFLAENGAGTNTQAARIAGVLTDVTNGAVQGALYFQTNNQTNDGMATRAILDASGNLGLGVTPPAWPSGSKAVQVGFSYGASLSSRNAGNTTSHLTHNAWFNGTNWIYGASLIGASLYTMEGANAGSTHAWFVSAGGTAGNAITFTQAMTLDASGRLVLNGTDATVGSGQMVVNHGANNGLVINATAASNGAAIYLRNATDGTAGNINYSNDIRFYSISQAAERFKVTADGQVIAPDVYSDTVGGTNRDLYIDDTGKMGYVSSIRAAKTNIAALTETDWLLDLAPVTFNYRKKNEDGAYTDEPDGITEYGLIAEDTEPVNPELCFYDIVDGKPELRGINYSKLVVPMLKRIQMLEARLAVLEA